MVTRITSWIATPSYLEIGIWIEPWDKSVRYHREYVGIFGSYTQRWTWLNGSKESNQGSHVNSEELIIILDDLVREHETLNLFCKEFGI